MLIFFILLILFAFSLLLSFDYNYGAAGFIGCIIFGIYLAFHIINWSLASYNYNKMVVKREAFIKTLNDAREHKRDLEAAAITKEVAQWNQELAEAKYDNTVFLLKDYTDDRIMTLEPIY